MPVPAEVGAKFTKLAIPVIALTELWLTDVIPEFPVRVMVALAFAPEVTGFPALS